MKKLFIIAFIFSLGTSLLAQEVPKKQTKKQVRKQEKQKKATEMTRQEEEGILVYSSQSIWGLQLRSNGYGAFWEKGKKKSPRNGMVYGIEFNEIKDNKEDKLPNGTGGFSFGNPYVYGKINNFYSIQLGFGGHRIMGQKGNKNGVAVSVVYKGGLSIGLLRPYYIQVEDNGANKTIKYSPDPKTDSLFKYGFIIGSGGLGMGWGEMKFKPGVFAKTGLRFDFGRYNEVVSGIEVGVSAEYYTSNIPIMLYQKEKQFFYQGHIAFMFGRRK
ncbi:MAG TPA: hypothetical protein VIS75_06945 [Chitinophagaceae bacterium]